MEVINELEKLREFLYGAQSMGDRSQFYIVFEVGIARLDYILELMAEKKPDYNDVIIGMTVVREPDDNNGSE